MRNFVTFLALSLLLYAVSAWGATKWNLVKPSSGKHLKLNIAGQERSYWELQLEKPLTIEVEGPVELKVYTRSALPKKQSDVLYGFVSVIDDGKRYFIGRGSSYEKGISNPKKSSQRIAESRSVILDVPAGTHKYEFTLPEQAQAPVYARFLIPDGKDVNPSYIAYLPRKYLQEVQLEIKERQYIYYRADSENAVELEVIGPTRIRGLARLEFDHSIRGDKHFRIQVRENKKVISTNPMIAKVSGTATYTVTTDKVTARGENFYIDVPEGKHVYEVLTPDPGISILFRFYLPQKDLGNEYENENGENANLIKSLKIAGKG